MKIYLGADHRGYSLKEKIKVWLVEWGYEVDDVGAQVYDRNDDYVDYAKAVAERISSQADTRGILLCGSGHGVDIVANRFPQVRCILGFNVDVVMQGREHEDANVVSIPADWVSENEAKEMVNMFLKTQFSGEKRHQRRLEKVRNIGKGNSK